MNAVASSMHPQWLVETPHRALFAVGASNLMLSMGWWALWLLDARWGLFGLPASPMFPGWTHALVTPYLMFGPFIFGFLLTVFPRWMDVPGYSRWHYLPVAASLLLAQLLMLAGQFGHPLLLHAGVLLAVTGWSTGLVFLFDRLRQDNSRCWHARSVFAALLLGGIGLLALLAHQLLSDGQTIVLAIKLGIFGLLLPVYFTVAHRMFPFFASAVLPGYRMWRPLPLLAAMWLLVLGHLLLELAGAGRWLWLVDLPMFAMTACMLWRWWPRGRVPPILRALFVGFAWMPLAFALYSLQSLLLAIDGSYLLGRAPLHALTIGLFGSVLVAMVSRVSKGHSGRLLQMTRVDRFAFVAIQAVAVLRVAAEVGSDTLGWNALAAVGWVLVLAPWLLHNAVIWSSPRADGRPG